MNEFASFGFLSLQNKKERDFVTEMNDSVPELTNEKEVKEKLILASASPRRRELMDKLGKPFISETSEAKETVPADILPEDTAEYLSGLKAAEVFSRHPGENVTVIGSDTIVLMDGVIYGKPKDEDDAYRMLRALSGRTHEVRTGVTILWRGQREGSIRFTSVTKVIFYELTDEEIRKYIAGGEPMDKAGAYGIQGQGALLVKEIQGDYYTVMGFPIGEIYRRMKEHALL